MANEKETNRKTLNLIIEFLSKSTPVDGAGELGQLGQDTRDLIRSHLRMEALVNGTIDQGDYNELSGEQIINERVIGVWNSFAREQQAHSRKQNKQII